MSRDVLFTSIGYIINILMLISVFLIFWDVLPWTVGALLLILIRIIYKFLEWLIVDRFDEL